MNLTDSFYMRQALELARLSADAVLPNPQVGALLVREGRILGQGRHEVYGGPHAEENALRDCREKGEDPAGADLYVTLEPCSFRSPGKHNGPCTEKIIDARIKRVLIARPDPNPQVRGRGIQALKAAGIETDWGILEEESARMNEVYEALITRNRPYIHLKAALTLDGYLAAEDGSSKWISGPESRMRVMALRAASDAVAVGRKTRDEDQPALTVRDEMGNPLPGKQPEKIILSRSQGSLEEILVSCRERGLHRILVEGGSGIFTAFLKEGLWDRLTLFLAPAVLGSGLSFCGPLGRSSMADKLSLQDVQYHPRGRDMEISGLREGYACLRV